MPEKSLAYGYIIALNADVFDKCKFQGNTLAGSFAGFFDILFVKDKKSGPFSSFYAEGNGFKFRIESKIPFEIMKIYSADENSFFYYLLYNPKAEEIINIQFR